MSKPFSEYNYKRAIYFYNIITLLCNALAVWVCMFKKGLIICKDSEYGKKMPDLMVKRYYNTTSYCCINTTHSYLLHRSPYRRFRGFWTIGSLDH
jgi:hypothetical protein